jgi:hypothetical protein
MHRHFGLLTRWSIAALRTQGFACTAEIGAARHLLPVGPYVVTFRVCRGLFVHSLDPGKEVSCLPQIQ